jgi:hypothetical protein
MESDKLRSLVIIVTPHLTRTASGHLYLHHKYLYLQRMFTPPNQPVLAQ